MATGTSRFGTLLAIGVASLSCTDLDRAPGAGAAGLRDGRKPRDEVPALFRGTNVSLESLDLFGPFYHRRRHFPEVRELTDVSVVTLVPGLRAPDQLATDSSTFILDGTQGVVAFSRGLTGMGGGKLDALKGAGQMAVLPDGVVAVVRADGAVDACARFTGGAVQYQGGCQPLPFRARRIAAGGTDDLLILTEAGALVDVDVVTGESEEIQVPLPGLTEISGDGDFYAFAYNDGYGLAAFKNVGGHCVREWRTWRACQTTAAVPGHACEAPRTAFHACKRSDPGNHTVRFKLAVMGSLEAVPLPIEGGPSPAIRFCGIARGADGVHYAVSRELDTMVLLDAHLEPLGAMFYFPQWPRPFRRVTGVRGVRVAPPSAQVHIFNGSAIETFSDHEDDTLDLLRRTPAELVSVLQAIADIPQDSFDADPTQDLTARPEIQARIRAALDQLPLE